MFARRGVLVGGLAAVVSSVGLPRAFGAVVPPSRRLFRNGRLGSNPVAARFETVPGGLSVPSVHLVSTEGARELSGLKKPATIVSLWADWCAPCLSEMHDLADLRLRHEEGLAVLALLQGSKLDPVQAAARLRSLGAGSLPSWIEPDGSTIVMALATPKGAKGFTLPCNLLFDRHGRLRGRAFGSHVLSHVDRTPGGLTDAARRQLEHARTAWATSAADEFADALAAGALDHIA